MTHKEQQKATRQQRALSRRAELRKLHKALKLWQTVAQKQAYDGVKMYKEIQTLRKKIEEIENRIPKWLRSFWYY